jgi:hypothetical protein
MTDRLQENFNKEQEQRHYLQMRWKIRRFHGRGRKRQPFWRIQLNTNGRRG